VFYFSPAERVALLVLLVLLVSGVGLLIYQQGLTAGRAESGGPLLSEPVAAAPAASSQTRATSQSESARVAGPPSAESREQQPWSAARRPSSPAPRVDLGANAGKVSLNTASAAQLDALPGIGPVYARRIAEYRERKRKETGQGFESVDELLNIPGIGPKRLAALRERVVP